MEGPHRLSIVVGSFALAMAGCTMVGATEGGPDTSRPPPAPIVFERSYDGDGAAREPEAPSRRGNMDRYRQSGRTYRVLESSYGYDERGIASWYGEAFHGRPTSSGEPYDMHALTAAHRTLPLPSWVEVTNLANGRSIVLRVNDRGPFHDPDRRIIDVSHAAAVRLGMEGTGTAAVRVRAVEPWQTRTAPPGR